MNSEKRRYKRRHLIYYLRVFDKNTNMLVGHLVDIASGGVMLISEKPFETDKVFNFRMDLPKEIRGTKTFAFTAKSKWCKTDENPDFVDTGFELLDAKEEDAIIIENLIEDFLFHDWEE